MPERGSRRAGGCRRWGFAMRKWALASAILLLVLPSSFLDQGRKLHTNAENSGDAGGLVDPLKVEEKLGAVPGGLSIDSDVCGELRRDVLDGADVFYGLRGVRRGYAKVFFIGSRRLWRRGTPG